MHASASGLTKKDVTGDVAPVFREEEPVKRRMLMTLLLSGGILVGSGLVATAWAQAIPTSTTPSKAYYVAEFELTNPDTIRPYSQNVASTFEPFGGKFIVRGGKVIALEGKGPGARTVVIEFPSLERAQAWYDSPAYRDLRPVRQRSGVSRTYIIEGISN